MLPKVESGQQMKLGLYVVHAELHEAPLSPSIHIFEFTTDPTRPIISFFQILLHICSHKIVQTAFLSYHT